MNQRFGYQRALIGLSLSALMFLGFAAVTNALRVGTRPADNGVLTSLESSGNQPHIGNEDPKPLVLAKHANNPRYIPRKFSTHGPTRVVDQLPEINDPVRRTQVAALAALARPDDSFLAHSLAVAAGLILIAGALIVLARNQRRPEIL